MNGGAWLTIGGQRVDFIYRNLDHIERVIVKAEAGGYELDYAQQPPFGFFSGTYLGEIAVCISLFDPEARIDMLNGGSRSTPKPCDAPWCRTICGRRNSDSRPSPANSRFVPTRMGQALA